MFNNLPKKWSRRLFAIYVAVTIFGGLVFALFLILIGLMYWMNAQVDLPAHTQVVHPDAGVKLIIRADSLEKLPEPITVALTESLPEQIRNLFDRTSHAPVLIGISLPPESDSRLLVAAVGRGPGQFYLVRRDMEKRAKKGTIPFAGQEYKDVVVFTPAPGATESESFALVKCSLVKSSDLKQVQAAAERMASPAEQSATLAEGLSNGFALEAQTLDQLITLLPDDRLRQFRERCPQLAQKSVEAWGSFSNLTSVQVAFSSDNPELLAENIRTAVETLSVESAKVEASADGVLLSFKLRLDGNHVQTDAGD